MVIKIYSSMNYALSLLNSYVLKDFNGVSEPPFKISLAKTGIITVKGMLIKLITPSKIKISLIDANPKVLLNFFPN